MFNLTKPVDEFCIKRCVIVAGMSGAGKSSALNVFEDLGYYVIDNLPPKLMPQLLDVLSDNSAVMNNGIAAVVDVRNADLRKDLIDVIRIVKPKIKQFDILFLDATDVSLVRRYETTRRAHPYALGSTTLNGISAERRAMKKVREMANIVIDTSGLNASEFKNKMLSCVTDDDQDKLRIIVSSFGFKYGVPQDSDYIFDVRFLPNPNYEMSLKHFSGCDKEIQEYLSNYSSTKTFLDKAEELVQFVATVYKNTGKRQLHVAIGCTGGRHRSVAVTEQLARRLTRYPVYITVEHRDIDKGHNW